MNDLLPLLVAVPLLSAAALAGLGAFIPGRVTELVAVGVAAATSVLAFIVLLDARAHDLVYWFGGWQPSGGHALGIAFTVNELDAGIACLVCVLAVAALTFSIRYFDDAGHLFQVLVLVFLAGMTGFSITGDLFNLFVFFELMTVSGYALCGYRVERPSVMQGTLNFAILNTIGAFFVVMGIALLYGRTGALNLAQIGERLSHQPADATTGIAFALLCVGFLVKAGAIPFHFWLSDAYAVAAAPAGALFAGVMSDLGYHALARVYWTCFRDSVAGDAGHIRAVLLTVGVVTAVGGAVMCYLQADLKRQLAFLVVSHGGASLTMAGLLNAEGMSASTAYVISDGVLKGAVFLALGLTVAALHGSNELQLRGRGRQRRLLAVGVVLGVASVGMGALPGFGTWRAMSLSAGAARSAGLGWLPFVVAATTAVTVGTLLRSYARVFLGWGRGSDPALAGEGDDEIGGESEERSAPSRWLVLAPALLVAAGFALGLAPPLAGHAVAAGRVFVDTHAYAGQVLRGVVPPAHAVPAAHVGATAWLTSALTLALAVLTASWGLWGDRLRAARRAESRPPSATVRALHAVHSGVVSDYVVWLTGGAAALCVTLSAIAR
jgi:multicomponent Na+:H+ antiporter subunit D